MIGKADHVQSRLLGGGGHGKAGFLPVKGNGRMHMGINQDHEGSSLFLN
jgi:hypothetical protein